MTDFTKSTNTAVQLQRPEKGENLPPALDRVQDVAVVDLVDQGQPGRKHIIAFCLLLKFYSTKKLKTFRCGNVQTLPLLKLLMALLP